MEESKFTSPTACAQHLSVSLTEVQQQQSLMTSRDPSLRRPDTARAVLLNLEKLEQLLLLLQKQPQETQEACYWLVLNITQEMVAYCRKMREAGFTKEITRYLAGASLAMETNIVAAATRYMDWRISVYRELAEVYEEMGAMKAAMKVVFHGLKQLQTMKEFEEAELPVPESVRVILEKGFFEMRALELKYGLIVGSLTPDAWKKRLEEVYGTAEKSLKLSYALASLSVQKLGQSRIALQQGITVAWKPLILSYIIEMVTADIKTVYQSLQEMEEKRQRDSSYLEATTRKQNSSMEAVVEGEEGENEPNLQELLAANRAADAKMIKEKAFKTAISTVPFALHLQLLKQCYDCKLWDQFFNLAEWAEVRIRLRRLEVPFITDVDLLVSSIQDPKIPKGYERLDLDLNVSHLRQELAKIGISLEPGKGAVKKPDKKEEAKKPDPKAKGGKPPAKEAAKKPDEIFEEERDVVGLVKHSFVYLILKKGSSEDDAISQLEIEFGGVDVSPEIPPGGKTIALPVDPHRKKGEEEVPIRKVPYLTVLKLAQTHGSRLNLVTDLIPVISKSPNTPVASGYTKMTTDLRQTPIDQERLPNNTYVFLAYQTEKETSMLIKDFRILTALRRLEQNKSTAENVSEVNVALGAKWDVELLAQLAEVIRNEIRGIEGEEYAKERQDLLSDVVLKMWSDFVSPVLQAKTKCDARGVYSEISEGSYASIQERWGEIEHYLRSALDSVFRVLTLKADICDPIATLNIGLSFVQLLEAADEYRHAVQILRRLQTEVIKVREMKLGRGVEARKDADLPKCISTSALQIAALRKEMRTELVSWKHKVERKLRDLERKKPIDEVEGDEEQWEVVRNAGEREQLEREEAEYASEIVLSEEEKDLFALHTQIMMSLFRCELELERRGNSERYATLKTYESQGIEVNPHNSGISASVFLKSKQGTGKSAKKVKTDVQSLQQTLQETGRLPPKKPKLSAIEKILLVENSKNAYAQALLYMQMARYKSNPQEQKALLKDSLNFIKQAEAAQESMRKIAIVNSPQILAAQQWNHSTKDTHLDFYPFRLLSDNRVIEPRLTPEKPVVVSRSMTSITVKMVSFNPKVINKFDIKKVKTLALYGKEARSGTDVSLTNYDLENLGKQVEIDSVVTVSGLTPHEEYHFAVAAFDEAGECIGGIGETCSTVITLLPLPVNLLLCYLAQVAFNLKQYLMSLKAANAILQRFTEPRKSSPLMALRLRLPEIHACSKAEIRDLLVTFTLYVSALQLSDEETLQLQLLRDPDYRLVEHVTTQERVMKYCNVLLLALELAVMIEDVAMIKEVIWKLNDTFRPLLELKVAQPEILHGLLKVYTALCMIPADLSEPAIRKICALATQQLMRTCLQLNLAPLLVSVLTTDVQFPRRQLTAESLQHPGEMEEMALYEVMARCDETLDTAKKMADRWKEALAAITDPELAASVGSIRQEADAVIEALTLMKTNPDGGLLKMNQAPNSHYLEWCVKAIRMLMEKGTDLKLVAQSLALVNVPPLPQTMGFIQEKVSLLQDDSLAQAMMVEPPASTEENPTHRLWASEVFLLTAAVDFLLSYKPQRDEAHSFLDIRSIEVGQLVKEDAEVKPITLEKPLELLMKSIVAARLSHAWGQLQNGLRLCTNLLTCFLPSPMSLAQTESWASLTVMAQCSLDFLESVCGLDTYRHSSSPKVGFEDTKPSIAPKSASSTSHDEATRPWFLSQEKVEIYLHANIVALAVQTLLCAKRWQALVKICDRLNAVTQNYFAGPILPFKIYAEKTLFDAAKAATERKLEELEARNQEYEAWKANTKRRKTRQAMLTGEVPQEQLDYERDVKALTLEIEARQTTENALRNKLRTSEEQLEAIKRGANTAYENLVQARKLMEQYGTEARALERETQDAANKMKRKAQKAFANIALGSYRKSVEILRKRRERSLLAQALHELGCLCLVEGNLEEAEAVWSDSVDTVFQSLYCISTFRKLLGTDVLAEKYGSQECLLAGVVLYKMSLHCYESTDAHRARECLLFASQLLSSPLKLSLPHPSSYIGFKLYRLQELTPNCSFLDINRTVPLSEIATALEFVSRGLIEYTSYAEVLPLTAFLEGLACDYLMSTSLAVKARTLRAAALAHMGYIDESLESLQKLIAMKDLPSAMIKRSLARERENAFWTAKVRFSNSLPPEHAQNQEAVQYLIKAEVPVNLAVAAGSYCYLETLYIKGLLLARLGQTENLEDPASEPLRKQLNAEADRVLRLVLKSLSYEEELTRTKDEWTPETGKQLDAYIQSRAPDILPADALIRDQIAASLFTITEENLTDSDKRILRLKLMVRAREVLSMVRQSEGEFSLAVKVIKQCLINLQKYSQGQLMVETGTEKDLFPQGAVLEEKKEAPKKAKDDKKRAESPSTQIRPTTAALAQAAAARYAQWAYRDVPSPCVWLRVKYRLLTLLYFQTRFQESSALLEELSKESESMKDAFYARQGLEIKAYLLLREGKLDEGLVAFEQMRTFAINAKLNDPGFACGLGNYGHLLAHRTHFAEAWDILKQARELLWDYLLTSGLVVFPEDLNKDAGDRGVLIIGSVKEEAKAPEGKPGDKKKPAVPDPKEEAAKKQRVSAANAAQQNSTFSPANIYLPYKHQIVVLNLTFLQAWLQKDENREELKEMSETIETTLAIASATVHLPNAILAQAKLLQGKLWRVAVHTEMVAMQSHFVKLAETRKRYRKFARNIPVYSLASGRNLLGLPGFNERLTELWLPQLLKTREVLEQSIRLATKESILLTLEDNFRELYQVLAMLKEFRPRVGYKYLENKSRPPDSVLGDGKIYFEDLKEADKLDQHRLLKEMTKTLTLLKEVGEAKKYLTTQYSLLGTASVQDPTKIPKLAMLDILESDYNCKKTYAAGLFDESKKKTIVNSYDLVTYFLKNYWDMTLVPLGREWRTHVLLKLHRFIAAFLPNYQIKNKFQWDSAPKSTSLAELVAAAGSCLGFWDLRHHGIVDKVYLNYLFAQMDPDKIVRNNIGEEVGVLEFSHKDEFFYGEIRSDPSELSQCLQTILDLRDKFNASYQLSQEKYDRDMVYYTKDFKDVLFKFATMFNDTLSLMKEGETNVLREKAQMAIEELAPEVSEAVLVAFASALRTGAFSIVEPNLNALFRFFHSLRYTT